MTGSASPHVTKEIWWLATMWGLPCSQCCDSAWRLSNSSYSQLLSSLYGKSIFSKIDLVRGLSSNPDRTSGHSEDCHHHHTFRAFWICQNAFRPSQCSQRFMVQVLRDLPFAYTYIDDVLLASSSPKENGSVNTRLLSTHPSVSLVYLSSHFSVTQLINMASAHFFPKSKHSSPSLNLLRNVNCVSFWDS